MRARWVATVAMAMLLTGGISATAPALPIDPLPPVDSDAPFPDLPPIDDEPPIRAADRIWSGWFVEPSGGQTDVPPSVAAFDDRLFAFAKGASDRRVYVQSAGLDGLDGSWVEVPGRVVWATPLGESEGGGIDRQSTMRTNVSVAAASAGGRLYVVARAAGDGRLYANAKLARGDRLAAWGAWHALPLGPTDVAPAAAGTSSLLFVFRTAPDHSVYAIRRGGPWSSWKYVDGPDTDLSPTAAAHQASGVVALFRVAMGSGAIYANILGTSGLWGPACAIDPEARTDAPAAAAWDASNLRLFYKGLDNRIYVQTLVNLRPYDRDCPSWSRPLEVRGGGIIDGAPAAAYLAAADRLALLVKGFGVHDVYVNVNAVLSLPLQAIRLADKAGGSCTTPVADVLADDVKQWAAYANRAFAPAFIRFSFDPDTDFETNLCDTRLNQASPDLAVATEVAARPAYKGKVVVFFRARSSGNGYSWWDPASTDPWERVNFVLMPGFRETTVCGHQNIAQLAHDLGHYLGLPHTFLGKSTPFINPGAKPDPSDDTPDPDAARAWLLGGMTMDGDGFADTPQDPGVALVSPCGPDPEDVFFLVSADRPPLRFQPPRTNLMSYYSDAAATFGKDPLVQTLTPQQIERVYRAIDERRLVP
jgi:hypothetical protein